MVPGLLPAHTRKSIFHSKNPRSSGSRLNLEKLASSAGDFIVSPETGLWLLPVIVAEGDCENDASRLTYLATNPEAPSRAITDKWKTLAKILGRTSIGPMGCMDSGLRGNQLPERVAGELAGVEMGTPTTTEESDFEHVSMCGNPDCYNPRHYHLEFAKSGKTTELIPGWYMVADSGEIATIWGDMLPSVATSYNYFVDFQSKNFPFVPIEKSPLTSTPMSQIIFHPYTGCWESYMYESNTPGLANKKNGYGAMYARKEPDRVDIDTGEIFRGYRRGTVLAHKLIWSASGRMLDSTKELNHLCNYTRCCNPLHIEQVDSAVNREHGDRTRKFRRAYAASYPDSPTKPLTKVELRLLYRSVF